MKATFKASDPKDLTFTLTVSMSLEHWKALRAQLGDQWPSWQFGAAIRDLVTKAEQTFYSEHDVQR